MKPESHNTVHAQPDRTGSSVSASSSASVPIAAFYSLVVVLTAVACTLAFSADRVELIVLFAVAVAALFLFRIWMPGILLCIVQISLYLGQPQLLIDSISPFDMLISFSVVLLLITSSRFLVLTPEQSPTAVIAAAVGRWLPQRYRKLTLSPLTRTDNSAVAAERGTALLRAVVAVAGAIILLMSIPVVPDARDEVQLIPVGLRLISLGVLMLGIFLVTSFLLDVMDWRRISPREARLFMGSVLTSWCDRELRTIHRQAQKLRQKRR